MRGDQIAVSNIRTFSFSQMTVNDWNRLYVDTVGVGVNMFKNKIDIYLRRAGYT